MIMAPALGASACSEMPPKIPHPQIGQAKALACRLHGDQVDKAGAPYMGHLARVAAAAPPAPAYQAAAWLHDSIEDCRIGPEFLRRHGIPADVVEAVVAISKVPGEPYEHYLERVKSNPIARAVKLADLADNMDLSRIPNPGHKDHQRVVKYKAAAAFLSA